MLPNFFSTEQATEYVKENFLWSLKESFTLRPSLLPENHHGLSLNFDLLMAMQYAHNSRILEMTHAIFYAMVVNNARELGLSSRIAMDCMISALNWGVIESWLWGIEKRLRRAQIPRLVDLIANPAPAGGPEEDSRLNDALSA